MLEQALALHKQGQYAAAEDLYQRVLLLQPQHFDALHLLGVAARQRGDADMAITWLRQAIAVDPLQAIAHSNLGAALQDKGLSQQALDSYDRALQLRPTYAMAWNNRGNALRSLGRMTAALHSYDQALQIQPDYTEAMLNRGIALQDAGEHEQALDDFADALSLRSNDAAIHFARAVSLQFLQRFEAAIAAYELSLRLPGQRAQQADAWLNLGICLQKNGQPEAALDSFTQAIRIRGDFARAHQQCGHVLHLLGRHQEAIHAYRQAAKHSRSQQEQNHIAYALASLGAAAMPAASPATYVEDLFDQYAGHFDQHLLEVLGYQVPRLIAGAINRHRQKESAITLDLGCGTGLCAPWLRPYSAQLTGIDLSEKMLDKARLTGLYDALHHQELSAFLRQQSAGADLVVAADVFVYIGDLNEIFNEVSRILNHSGLFVFSVEAGHDEQASYTLAPSQRYTHSLPYLQRLAQQHGFDIAETSQQAARQDKGEDILVHILVLIRG